MLGSANFGDVLVIADLEAGIGTLTRLDAQSIDVVVVVVEPTPRSIDVAQRAVELATAREQGRLIVVANRVTGAADVDRVAAGLPGCEIVAVPHDPAIMDADRRGVSPLDSAPDSPAVIALIGLASRLVSS